LSVGGGGGGGGGAPPPPARSERYEDELLRDGIAKRPPIS
jgi:hypothetical protein